MGSRNPAVNRIGGYASWANDQDRSARARKSVETRLQRYEREIDPTGKMSDRDRRKAAEGRMKMQMAQASLAASKARKAARTA